MAQTIVMPKLGQTVEECTIVSWHKQKGDPVKKGDILFEIETDKAVLEVESFYDGILLEVLVGEGETVPVSTIVAYVGKEGEKVPEFRVQSSEFRVQKGEEIRKEKREEPRTADFKRPPSAINHQPSTIAGAQTRLFISPRARALARECVIDPAGIQGTGPNGRIVVRDVKAYLDAGGYDRIRITPAAKKLANVEGINILKVKGAGVSDRIMVSDIRRAIKEKPKTMSKMRQVIAGRLTESFTTTPHFYITVSADMTDLLAFRKKLKQRGEIYGVTDFILKAVILPLKEFPVMNSVTDGITVRWHGSVDLGMAVGLEEGLVVPVIRNAEELSMKRLHEIAETLAVKAREGKLLPDEMTGSTFTVSNMGMLDVENFTAIINPGECAILAVASTVERAVAVDGRVKIRSMMKMTLSADHRVVDGIIGTRFINAIKNKLEDMDLWRSLT